MRATLTNKKTLEDALAQMEASNAKAAELRANQAPKLIAEAVKRTALNARLAALPQAQRNQVLDAAGIPRASEAPRPITPLRGGSCSPPRQPTVVHTIDWQFWLNLKTVTLWQACALVVGLDPDKLKHSAHGWMAGPGAGPSFEDRSFPNLETKDRFEKALRLAESAMSYMGGPIVPQGALNPGNKQRKDVLLSQVVAFFSGFNWTGVPEELDAIAQTAAPVATPQPLPKNESANEWVSEAQSRAREFIKEQQARDRYPDQIGIADQIAKEFRTAGKFGADGKPLSGAYIKRHALKGISSAVPKQLSTTKRQSK